jgi:hypothetical protein
VEFDVSYCNPLPQRIFLDTDVTRRCAIRKAGCKVQAIWPSLFGILDYGYTQRYVDAEPQNN